jgi:hypothetical protein
MSLRGGTVAGVDPGQRSQPKARGPLAATVGGPHALPRWRGRRNRSGELSAVARSPEVVGNPLWCVVSRVFGCVRTQRRSRIQLGRCGDSVMAGDAPAMSRGGGRTPAISCSFKQGPNHAAIYSYSSYTVSRT